MHFLFTETAMTTHVNDYLDDISLADHITRRIERDHALRSIIAEHASKNRDRLLFDVVRTLVTDYLAVNRKIMISADDTHLNGPCKRISIMLKRKLASTPPPFEN
jgi:hypothetical protein